MRHVYQTTTESIKVLSHNPMRIAEEMNVSSQYIYAILAGTETDIFAKYEHLYASAKRADCPVWHWRNKQDAIDARYDDREPKQSVIECLTAKIKTSADTTARLVSALRDGGIDTRETVRIQMAINRERKTLDLIETHLHLAGSSKEIWRAA